jgi:hypothetical protein
MMLSRNVCVIIAMSYIGESSAITRSLVKHSATLAAHPQIKRAIDSLIWENRDE